MSTFTEMPEAERERLIGAMVDLLRGLPMADALLLLSDATSVACMEMPPDDHCHTVEWFHSDLQRALKSRLH
jgi:hypothetical protein